jgi:hypothetical protein
MSKITEQQLIESAKRLKTIVKEDNGDVKADKIGQNTGLGVGGTVGVMTANPVIDRLAGRAGSVDAAGNVTKKIEGLFPETFIKLTSAKGRFLTKSIFGLIGAVVGIYQGKSLGQWIDDWKGTRRQWNDRLGLSGVTFTPNWRELNVNYYGTSPVTLDPNSGLFVVQGSGDNNTFGVDDRIRDTTHYQALAQQALMAIATGKANLREPVGGWDVELPDHIAILSKANPALRDQFITVYNNLHPNTPFNTASLTPPYKAPPAAPPAAPEQSTNGIIWR